jgi:hypothetical protein
MPKKSGQSDHAKSSEHLKKTPAESSWLLKKQLKDDREFSDDNKSAASNESRKRGRSMSHPHSILKASKKSKVTFERKERSQSKCNCRSKKSKYPANRDKSSSGESSTERKKK